MPTDHATETLDNLPLPGFLRGRVIRGLVRSTVEGLKEYVES